MFTVTHERLGIFIQLFLVLPPSDTRPEYSNRNEGQRNLFTYVSAASRAFYPYTHWKADGGIAVDSEHIKEMSDYNLSICILQVMILTFIQGFLCVHSPTPTATYCTATPVNILLTVVFETSRSENV